MVKRKNKSKRIKQASKDYLRNNNNSTEGNKTKEKKKQLDREESSPSSSVAQRERTIQETIPEVFNSSRYNAMVEIKESSTMQEKDMKEALSTTEKKEPRRKEMEKTESTDNNNVNTDAPAINSLIQEEQQASILRESKEGEVTKTGIIISDYKNIQNTESYRKQENLNYPNVFTTSIGLWQNYTMAWIVTYNEFVRNTGRMAAYWSHLFWNPLSTKEEYHQYQHQ